MGKCNVTPASDWLEGNRTYCCSFWICQSLYDSNHIVTAVNFIYLFFILMKQFPLHFGAPYPLLESNSSYPGQDEWVWLTSISMCLKKTLCKTPFQLLSNYA